MWIIIYITSEARHLRVTGTIEQALAATAASAWMKLFLHEPTLHKARRWTLKTRPQSSHGKPACREFAARLPSACHSQRLPHGLHKRCA